MAFFAEDRALVWASVGGDVRFLEVPSGRKLGQTETTDNNVYAMAVDDEIGHIALGHLQNGIKMYSLPSGVDVQQAVEGKKKIDLGELHFEVAEMGISSLGFFLASWMGVGVGWVPQRPALAGRGSRAPRRALLRLRYR